MDLELLQFKTEINLPELAIQFGYEMDSRKSSKNCIVMKSPSDEKFLFYKNRENGHYLYVNASANSKPDSIIGFVQYNIPDFSLGDVRHFLRQRLGASIIQSKTVALEPTIKPNPRQFSLPASISTFTNFQYLNKRGIVNQIICNSLFKDTISQYNVSTKGDITHHNLAFPIHNFNQLVGYELKNSHFKGTLENSQKSEGFWNSNIPPKPISSMIVVESPIEALSHYQLFENKLKNNSPLYISSNGNPSNNHLQLLHDYINFYQPGKIGLANNNDLAGMRFNINYLGSASRQSQSTITFKLSVAKNSYANLRILVHNPPTFNNSSLPNSHYDNLYQNYLAKLNTEASKSQFVQGYSKPFTLSTEKIDRTTTLYQFSFHNSQLNLAQIFKICQEITPNKHFVIHAPTAKDFNQDLLNHLKKHTCNISTRK